LTLLRDLSIVFTVDKLKIQYKWYSQLDRKPTFKSKLYTRKKKYDL